MNDRLRLKAVARANGWTLVEPLDPYLFYPYLFFEWDCFTRNGCKVRLSWRRHTLICVRRGTAIECVDEARRDGGYSVAELVEIARTWLKQDSAELPVKRSAAADDLPVPTAPGDPANPGQLDGDALRVAGSIDPRKLRLTGGAFLRGWRRFFTAKN